MPYVVVKQQASRLQGLLTPRGPLAERWRLHSVRVGGTRVHRWSPGRAMRAGVAYVPAERKTEGLLLDKSVGRNLTLAILSSLPWRVGIVDRGNERRVVREAIARAVVKTSGPGEPIGNLSGGNQQKVLLGRWLATHPELLILDEPT
ncbi:MAG: sugar ABC transporter ATP-binding protein, partial [Myxococcales bacterium]|nr:sugar ABC transporter ATP-binding protein [Myxococcales bacterium]